MGACAADYDNDGAIDLFVTGAGANALYHNNGNGTFTDVSAKAGIGGGPFATSCACADVDRDGFVDLFVTNYVDARPQTTSSAASQPRTPGCTATRSTSRRWPRSLYHNNGNGTFTDVSAKAGIAGHRSNGLGVVIGDYDDDGWPDIAVANDSMPNFLYHNEGARRVQGSRPGLAASRWRPTAIRAPAWASISPTTTATAGWISSSRTTSSKRTRSSTTWARALRDVTSQSGIGLETLPYVGFGTVFFDYDNDGDLDLAITNGHVVDNSGHYRPGSKTEQRKLLFRNDGGRFKEIGRLAGPGFAIEKIGRSLDVADIDNDGSLDLLFTNNGDTPNLLRNTTGRGEQRAPRAARGHAQQPQRRRRAARADRRGR